MRVVFTCGDINGIGPETAIKTFNYIFSKKNRNTILFICPKNIFHFYYKQTKAAFNFNILTNNNYLSDKLNLILLPAVKFNFGKPTKSSGKTAYQSIIQAIDILNNNKADCLVTSPISKEAFHKAGINFPGHTELLASSEQNKNFMMMFLSKKIKAGLLTIHIPIKKVSQAIKQDKILKHLNIIHKTAMVDFGIQSPKIAMLGLNPHAGENGLIGNEEERTIKPLIKKIEHSLSVYGPFVPDAFWGSKMFEHFDFVLGLYHDQVLIPFKLLNFNSGVNYTAGLKMIRTSPDHGTAFDIAGKNIADPSSTIEAYKFAIKIFNNRKAYLTRN